jgi:hypothetical protein
VDACAAAEVDPEFPFSAHNALSFVGPEAFCCCALAAAFASELLLSWKALFNMFSLDQCFPLYQWQRTLFFKWGALPKRQGHRHYDAKFSDKARRSRTCLWSFEMLLALAYSQKTENSSSRKSVISLLKSVCNRSRRGEDDYADQVSVVHSRFATI